MAKKDAPQYTATLDFRDKDNFDIAYTKDQEMPELSEEMTKYLLAKGFIEEVKEAKPATDAK